MPEPLDVVLLPAPLSTGQQFQLGILPLVASFENEEHLYWEQLGAAEETGSIVPDLAPLLPPPPPIETLTRQTNNNSLNGVVD